MRLRRDQLIADRERGEKHVKLRHGTSIREEEEEENHGEKTEALCLALLSLVPRSHQAGDRILPSISRAESPALPCEPRWSWQEQQEFEGCCLRDVHHKLILADLNTLTYIC